MNIPKNRSLPQTAKRHRKLSKNPFAEVVETSLERFTAHCWQWDTFPHFGSLVHIEEANLNIIGCVTHITTGSLEPNRYPFPYQKTEEELKAEQPQIFEFLKTTFTVTIVGYQENETMYYLLPPQPAKIHSFVSSAPHATIASFFAQPNFLYLLFAFSQHIPNVDELLLTLIKELASLQIMSKQLLDSYLQTFSLLTGNDYRRLKLFLQRVQDLKIC